MGVTMCNLSLQLVSPQYTRNPPIACNPKAPCSERFALCLNVYVLSFQVLRGDFKPPNFISRESRDLLRRMLTVDPARRATIEDVLAHPCATQQKQSQLSQLIAADCS